MSGRSVQYKLDKMDQTVNDLIDASLRSILGRVLWGILTASVLLAVVWLTAMLLVEG